MAEQVVRRRPGDQTNEGGTHVPATVDGKLAQCWARGASAREGREVGVRAAEWARGMREGKRKRKRNGCIADSDVSLVALTST